MEHYRAGLGIRPQEELANFYVGQLLVAQGKHQDAIEHFRATLFANPETTDEKYQLAKGLAVSGQLDTAIETYLQVLEERRIMSNRISLGSCAGEKTED